MFNSFFIGGIVDYTTNLALGKPANMSSTRYGSAATRAVDGSYEVNDYSSCAQTITIGILRGSWWMVDLESVYDIKMVMILNRKNCCGKLDK